jgi:hypothetical protein
MVFVGDESRDAPIREQSRDVGQQLDRLEDVARHHGDVDVEFERAVATAPGDRGVVTDDLGGDLGNRFGQNRIDLAGHDR